MRGKGREARSSPRREKEVWLLPPRKPPGEKADSSRRRGRSTFKSSKRGKREVYILGRPRTPEDIRGGDGRIEYITGEKLAGRTGKRGKVYPIKSQ